MMAAASCSVGIIPFHRPRLPYLDLSSYSPASDLVGSLPVSHTWTFPPSPGSHQHPARYPALARKRMAPIEILSGKFHPEFWFMPRSRARFPLLYFTHRLLDTPLIYVSSTPNSKLRAEHCRGKVKSGCKETYNICISGRAKSELGYKAGRKN